MKNITHLSTSERITVLETQVAEVTANLSAISAAIYEIKQSFSGIKDRFLGCDDTTRQVRIDSTFVGYGCTQEEAKNDFFRNVLNKISDTLRCSAGACDEQFTCVAELVKTGEIEQKLICNRISLTRCENANSVGWKCFLHDQPTISSDVNARCTCVPDAADEAFNVVFGKTTVDELFINNQILYYIDSDNKVIYSIDDACDAVRKRLNVIEYTETTWQLDFGAFQGAFAIKSNCVVGNILTVEVNSAAGIKGYACKSLPAGSCIISAGTNTSFKLVNAETPCINEPNVICDAIWGNIPVDSFQNRTCTPPAARIQRNTALCIII